MSPLTLPLVGLVALNLVPAIWLRPFWITAFGFALVGFRVWLARGERAMPPWWLRLPVQLAIVTAVWAQYRTFLGDEAAGALLTLLTCLKTYELRTPRDHFVGYLLCLLVLMSHLLLDASLPITLYLVGDGVLLTAYLYALGQGRLDLSGFSLGPTLRAVAKAAPLVVVTFLLFPRFTTGFGGGDDAGARMGITDQLRPGSVSSLIGSNELVFRARFVDGFTPPRATLYWRAAVLDRADGLNWDRGPVGRRLAPRAPTGPVVTEVTLEPGFDKFVYSTVEAGQPWFANEDVARAVIRRGGGTFELGQPLRTRERYELHLGAAPDDDDPSAHLSTKQPPGPRMTEFLGQHRGADAASTAHALLEVFRHDYAYTLSPPRARSLEDFMFGTRAGFCEHYAAALATMLRWSQVPARVVLGFQGGTTSWLERVVTVRAHDAHAWVEYHDGARWRRLDPTSQLDPRRIAEGADVYLGAGGAAVGFDSLFARARAAFDDVDAAWTSFLLRFDRTEQRRLMAKLGLGGEFAWILPVALVLAVAATLALLGWRDRRRAAGGPGERLRAELVRRATRVTGHPREPHETLDAYVARLDRADLARAGALATPLIYGAGPHPAAAWDEARRAVHAVGRAAE